MSTQADDSDFEVGHVSDLDDELTAELFRSSFQPSPRKTGVTHRWRDMSSGSERTAKGRRIGMIVGMPLARS